VAGRLAAQGSAPNAVWVVVCVVALRLTERLGVEVLGTLAIDKVVPAAVAAAAAGTHVMVAAAMPVLGVLQARRVCYGVLVRVACGAQHGTCGSRDVPGGIGLHTRDVGQKCGLTARRETDVLDVRLGGIEGVDNVASVIGKRVAAPGVALPGRDVRPKRRVAHVPQLWARPEYSAPWAVVVADLRDAG
jgi:hypothetical protein